MEISLYSGEFAQPVNVFWSGNAMRTPVTYPLTFDDAGLLIGGEQPPAVGGKDRHERGRVSVIAATVMNG